MSEAKTVPAKYIFLDIVGYTRNRSVEAQSDIVSALNNLVRQTVEAQKLKDDDVIYIPTGDGMCIALLNVAEPVDVHMQIALGILSSVNVHNEQATNEMRQFQIRVGINENVDNLLVDINGRRSVAGSGISMAQRIMDSADAGQILVGQSVFEAFNQREKYMMKFRPYDSKVKHGQRIRVYQYVQAGLPGLNIEVPSKFEQQVIAEPKLTKLAAHYFAHAIKLRQFLLKSTQDPYPRIVLLWFLAIDSVGQSEATELEPYEPKLPNICRGTIEEQLALLDNLPFWVACEFADLINQSPDLSPWSFKYFEGLSGDKLFVNPAGKDKLKKDWPNIWNKFGLS